MKKILAVIGARPQFIKHAPLELALRTHFELRTVHTGQHYDEKMSTIFFDELKLEKPFYQLNVGSHDHGVQTGKMMMQLEPICQEFLPDYLLVYGDTNSTLAGALVAAKMGIKVIHIEAGLRSFNREMPEEINRVATDHMSDILIVPTVAALGNLKAEGVIENVHYTGDIMKDMVLMSMRLFSERPVDLPEKFYYATIHRPYNTDSKERLTYVLESLNKLEFPVVLPLHPRTLNFSKQENIDLAHYSNIRFEEPKGYFDNIVTLLYAKGLVTDSGGMQKEAYILGVPCVTIRKETEWIETMIGNWNTLLFEDLSTIRESMSQDRTDYNADLYGSGSAAEEITRIILADCA